MGSSSRVVQVVGPRPGFDRLTPSPLQWGFSATPISRPPSRHSCPPPSLHWNSRDNGGVLILLDVYQLFKTQDSRKHVCSFPVSTFRSHFHWYNSGSKALVGNLQQRIILVAFFTGESQSLVLPSGSRGLFSWSHSRRDLSWNPLGRFLLHDNLLITPLPFLVGKYCSLLSH